MLDVIFYCSYVISFIGSMIYFVEESRTDEAFKLVNKAQFYFISASVSSVPFVNTVIMAACVLRRINQKQTT